MSALHQYISAVGSFQGVLLFFLLVCDRQTTAASKVLGLYCLAMGLAFLLPFITFGIAAEQFYPLAAWLFFLPVMYGALLYLYCRKVVFNEPLKPRDLLHALPLLACYLLNYDSLLFQHEEFRMWIYGQGSPNFRLWLSEYILFAIALAYLIATAFLLRRYYQQASNTLSNFNPDVFKWLGLLVFSFILIFMVKGVMAFGQVASMSWLVISDAMIVGIILVIALTQWKQPAFFQASDAPATGLLVEKNMKDRVSIAESTIYPGEPSSKRSDEGALSSQTRAAMFAELTALIDHQHAYRDSELTLPKLADILNMSAHHLSEVINKQAGKNFNQFINEYRIQEVRRELGSNDSQSVLDIAFKAGFSSKSTFNTLFKKQLGITPTQYRAQQTANR